MARQEIRHIVLDNEAAHALLSAQPGDRKWHNAVAAIKSIRGRRVVPTAVRAEAGWRRRDPAAAYANQLVRADHDFDKDAADRAVQLRGAVPSASVVDAAVAVAAERLGQDGNVVEVLTSDTSGMEALAVHLDARVEVLPL